MRPLRRDGRASARQTEFAATPAALHPPSGRPPFRSTDEYVFGRRVMERIGAPADVAEGSVQPGSFRTQRFIYPDSHPVTERTH